MPRISTKSGEGARRPPSEHTPAIRPERSEGSAGQLRDAIKQPLTEGGSGAWRDIATAPKDGTTWVLLYGMLRFGSKATTIGIWSRDEKSWLNPAGNIQPTHWQPLPPPPGSGGGEP